MDTQSLHRLLQRQIKKHLGSADKLSPEMEAFIKAVNETYQQADTDRVMVERSLDLASQELLARNQQLTQDLKQRQQIEAALRASEERLRTVINNAPLVLFVLDKNGLCTFIAGKAMQTLRITPEIALGKPLSHVLPHVSTLLEPTQRALAGESFTAIAETPRHAFEVSFVALTDGVIAVAFDITERRHAEKEMERAKNIAEAANRAKTEFLTNTSHELRTPLNAILGYSEMLIEEAQLLEDQAFTTDLQKIHSAGEHLLTLINAILDLSKVESGKVELYIEDFAVETLLEDVTNTIVPLMQRNHNVFEVQRGENLGGMRADLIKMRQILLNLLSNAAKFTLEGTITLTAKRLIDHRLPDQNAEDILEFMVSDTGVGMTDEQIAKLFKAFVQADASTTRKFGGTGLGLAISKYYCEAMGGEIEVRSQLNVGSTFTVRLPARVKPIESITIKRVED